MAVAVPSGMSDVGAEEEYAIVTKVEQREFKVGRRLSEFSELRRVICATTSPNVVVPRLPKISRSQSLVKIHLLLTLWLRYLARHPVLGVCDHVERFLTSSRRPTYSDETTMLCDDGNDPDLSLSGRSEDANERMTAAEDATTKIRHRCHNVMTRLSNLLRVHECTLSQSKAHSLALERMASAEKKSKENVMHRLITSFVRTHRKSVSIRNDATLLLSTDLAAALRFHGHLVLPELLAHLKRSRDDRQAEKAASPTTLCKEWKNMCRIRELDVSTAMRGLARDRLRLAQMQQRQWSGLARKFKVREDSPLYRRHRAARQQLCSIAERTSHLFGESSEVCQSSLGVRKTGHVEDESTSSSNATDSLFTVNIEHRYSPQMTHALFDVSVFKDDQRIGKTIRRFSEFKELHRKIVRQFQTTTHVKQHLPSLPRSGIGTKRLFGFMGGPKLDRDFLNARTVALKKYVTALLEIKEVRTCNDMRTFLAENERETDDVETKKNRSNDHDDETLLGVSDEAAERTSASGRHEKIDDEKTRKKKDNEERSSSRDASLGEENVACGRTVSSTGFLSSLRSIFASSPDGMESKSTVHRSRSERNDEDPTVSSQNHHARHPSMGRPTIPSVMSPRRLPKRRQWWNSPFCGNGLDDTTTLGDATKSASNRPSGSSSPEETVAVAEPSSYPGGNAARRMHEYMLKRDEQRRRKQQEQDELERTRRRQLEEARQRKKMSALHRVRNERQRHGAGSSSKRRFGARHLNTPGRQRSRSDSASGQRVNYRFANELETGNDAANSASSNNRRKVKHVAGTYREDAEKASTSTRTSNKNVSSKKMPWEIAEERARSKGATSARSAREQRSSTKGARTNEAKPSSTVHDSRSSPIRDTKPPTKTDTTATPAASVASNWIKAQRPSDGATYYYHRKTRAVRWDRPSSDVMRKVEARLQQEQMETEARQEERLRRLREEEERSQKEAECAAALTSKIDRKTEEWAKNKALHVLLRTLPEILPHISASKFPTLNRDAGTSEIKRAYRKALRIVHPDKQKNRVLEERLLAQRVFSTLVKAQASSMGE
eukprot:g767.t1